MSKNDDVTAHSTAVSPIAQEGDAGRKTCPSCYGSGGYHAPEGSHASDERCDICEGFGFIPTPASEIAKTPDGEGDTGKWIVCPNGRDVEVADGDYCFIASTMNGNYARLIAAAPELYEALAKLVHNASAEQWGYLGPYEDVEAAIAALSRARGETK